MAVYVDMMLNHGWKLRGRVIESCHLLADTKNELLEFAESKLELKPGWVQNGSLLHFDLTESKRTLAIKQGAVELDRKNFQEVYRKLVKAKANEIQGEAGG